MRIVNAGAATHNISIVRFLLVPLFLLILAGCAPKSYVVLLQSPDGTTGQVVVSGSGGTQTLATAGQRAPLDGSTPASPMKTEDIMAEFAQAIAARPKIPTQFLLYFTGGVTLTKESEALIPAIIAEAASRPAADLSVIGHTDTLKSDEYNDQLALQRAKKVAESLSAKGLKALTMTIEWHGKRNLLVQTPDNTFEPKNRRVEVSVR